MPMQVRPYVRRSYQRSWNDKSYTISNIIGNVAMALTIASIFFGTQNDTNNFFAKGGILFFCYSAGCAGSVSESPSVTGRRVSNPDCSVNEINSLYEQRQIVKKVSYAFYHPLTDDLADLVSNIPSKVVIGTRFNLILYFMTG